MNNFTDEDYIAKQKYVKSMKRIFIGIVVLISIGIGEKFYIDNKRFNDEMINVVQSSQVKKLIEEGLKKLDSNALTPTGIIQSYEIDDSSIEHNPMGGIMFDVIINDNKKLRVYNLLDKNISDGNLENIGGGNTSELENLLINGVE